MAGDQGKTSNVNALALMAEQRDQSIHEVGTTTFRPPFTPVPIGAFAGNEHGAHFEPTRLSPLHDWHCEQKAAQTLAGLWLRAWYYPREGETLDQAYKREAAHVRAKVGLVDVSSLGKILLQGPDAAEFLNRVYTNGWKSLKVGRVRYGIMLRDDGIILDDGTTARLSENEFFMTTTTANAGAVMSHLEFLLQTSWQNLMVRVTSVSDQWAGMALAGPSSRRVLERAVTDCDVSNEALPHMSLTHGTVDAVPVRIHRMSFSGELAYEIFVPAGFGQAVWQALLDAGKALDIRPYGTEALAALRIEKGHVAGPELDGRTTLSDLGLEGLASSKKPFIGKVLSSRPVLSAPDRPRLVGLETLRNGDRIKSGSILFTRSAERKGHGEGHVTSTTYSVHLGKNIALALLSNGERRIGETVVCSNPIEGQELEVKVVSSHFYDPQGGQLSG
jgi:sarcosine oxidase subunit alpha